LFPSLKELTGTGNNGRRRVVRDVFEDAYNYMKSGQLMRQVINKINTIDFNNLTERQHFGDIYEQILNDLQSAGNAGEYYTPRAVTAFMADRIDPHPGEILLDPACGTGGFITCSIRHMRERYVKKPADEHKMQQALRACEKKQLPHMLCVTNMLLHGIDDPSFVRHDNTLARPYISYGQSDRVDIVLTNPPFGGKEEDGIESNFPKHFQTRETADLFLALIVRQLKPSGRAAVVLPDGSLFGEGVKTRLKEHLMEGVHLVRKGDYLVGMDGDFNVRKWKGPEALLNQRVMRINNWRASVIAEFLAIPLQMILNHLHSSTSLTTVKHLSAKQTNGIYLPLPPLAEQQRIVAKVDELMALCDRLEAAQTERESRRERLAAAVHSSVCNSSFKIPHPTSLINHLPRLTTRPEQINQLRRTILDLAFGGRLTARWRETTEIKEPAQDCLGFAENGRKKAWESKQAFGSKRKYPAPVDFARENLPVIPDSWVWASADALCSQITDGEHIQPRYQAEGVPMLTAKHVRDGFVTFEDCELISESDFKKCVARCKPEKGDILIVSVGATTGRAAIVSQSRPFALVRSVLLVKPLTSAPFFLRWLQSPWCFAWMGQASEASAQPHLYIGDTKRMPVPLPPLAEQHRIVAKVNELMALCDRLEAQLTTTQTESRRFLEVVLHEALASVA
jgi:restriction endonuclease S subunit